jgi:hypothetical protein
MPHPAPGYQATPLSLFQAKIIYYPKLLPIGVTATGTILLQQLEYWFEFTGGHPFYKFLEPCKHKLYRDKDSWTEELGFSKEEFRNAFSNIGKAFKSKTEYEAAEDPFCRTNRNGERIDDYLYCSYYDKVQHVTYYFRNHDRVASAIRKAWEDASGDQQTQSPGNRETQSREIDKPNIATSGNPISIIGTETTAETTTETSPRDAAPKKPARRTFPAADYDEVVGYIESIQNLDPFKEQGKQRAKVKRLFELGVTVQQIKDIADLMAAEGWRKKIFDMVTIHANIDEYLQKLKKAQRVYADPADLPPDQGELMEEANKHQTFIQQQLQERGLALNPRTGRYERTQPTP